ncbi:MAG: xanthine dehydrogenase family protein molybdopterin-binding subunit [Oscillospiraceae bacterium]|jgi:CO/xanthine dehydrogenase Mo-binding subunit|nr:xanthine dehydrogenase family protein molybdopterin-binding subunit [Oscillospiraceae bacterium]
MSISESVIKTDHKRKITGEALYVADYPTAGLLFGRLLRSAKARARLIAVKPPELPSGYFYVDKNDVKGLNRVHIVQDDLPVFAEDTVEFIGDAIGMMVGPDRDTVEELAGKVTVEYEELTPVIRVEDSDTIFVDYHYDKGDAEKAFREADRVIEEVFETGHQEQAYLETQGIIARPEGERIVIHGSMQCPYYVHRAVAQATGYRPEQVRVKYDTTGGAFGGKEDYPSILAAQAAVAAIKAGRPVRVIFDRREDMEFTGKRHPSKCRYKAAIKNGRVTAMDIDVIYNSGAYITLSPVVIQRGIIGASGVYTIDNLKVRGRAVKTNTVPNGAFRGFGGPQTFFAVEMMMGHIAARLGEDALGFKLKHIAKKGDVTSTGGIHHFPVPLPAMIKQVCEACDFKSKREKYNTQTGTKRRGIGISLAYHGAGFTGRGEHELIKAVIRLHKYPDGRVEILTANTDMGQGLDTTFSKIAAGELNISLDRIIVEPADTDRVLDSGPTAASRSIMVVGELVRRGAARLRDEWREGDEQVIEEHFKEPDFVIPFNIKEFKGDAYPTCAWSVCAVEVELDTITGVARVLDACGSYDCGTPIDRRILIGQMEGGFMQAIGYASMEQMAADSSGRIRNNSLSDYIIPTAVDVPGLRCLLHEEAYPAGPFGAKGAGELPAVGGAAAYLEAMEQALGGVPLNHIPFSAENAIDILEKRGNAQ